MYRSYNQPKGVVLIFSVLAIGVAGFLAMLATMHASLSSVAMSDFTVKSVESDQYIKGCLDETIIQFRRDSSFSAESVNIGDVTCDLIIDTVSDNEREITVSRSSTINSRIKVIVDISTFEILNIEQ